MVDLSPSIMHIDSNFKTLYLKKIKKATKCVFSNLFPRARDKDLNNGEEFNYLPTIFLSVMGYGIQDESYHLLMHNRII